MMIPPQKVFYDGVLKLMPNHILGIFKREPHISFTQCDKYAYIGSEGVTKGKPDWDALAARYGTGDNGGVYIGFDDMGNRRDDHSPVWQAESFGSTNPCISSRGEMKRITINGWKLDTYTIQAIRRRKVKSSPIIDECIIENAIQGLLVKDGHFLLGKRGGQDQPGTLNVLPGEV